MKLNYKKGDTIHIKINGLVGEFEASVIEVKDNKAWVVMNDFAVNTLREWPTFNILERFPEELRGRISGLETIENKSYATLSRVDGPDYETATIDNLLYGYRFRFWIDMSDGDNEEESNKEANPIEDILEFYHLTDSELAQKMGCSPFKVAWMRKFNSMGVNDLLNLIYTFGYPGSYVTFENRYDKDKDNEDVIVDVKIRTDNKDSLIQTFERRYKWNPGEKPEFID